VSCALHLTTFIRYAQSRQVSKSNNFKSFGSKYAKGPKQDRQNRLQSPMPVGGEPYF
jgi:hypothetical protein